MECALASGHHFPLLKNIKFEDAWKFEGKARDETTEDH